MTNLEYIWNYYEHWATPNHPYDKGQLISAADGTRMFTCRDANGFVLCDMDRDLEVDQSECGSAFHEHSGRGVEGQLRGQPFTQFWLDDNWLARYMSETYSMPQPDGLQDQPGKFMRWKVIGGDTSDWNPYNSDHFDTLALDGLYHISRGEIQSAIGKWDSCVAKSQAFYDSGTQQFEYPDIHENYHVGLWKILTDFLLDDTTGQVSEAKRADILQHSVSLRSLILKNQEKDVYSGQPLGWITNIGDTNSLMNTESVSCGVLGLGASAQYTFEAWTAPMIIGEGYFVRHYHVLSAVVGQSPVGYMTQGPNLDQLSSGVNYQVEWYIRMPNPTDDALVLSIYDFTNGEIVNSVSVKATSLLNGNRWSRVGLMFVARPGRSYEFQTYWTGITNVDVSLIRVK